MKKLFLIITVMSILFILLSYSYFKDNKQPAMERAEIINSSETEDQLPQYLNIKLPFYPQAPYADWSLPYQEACEEASVLLAANLFNHLRLNRSSFNNELLKIVAWENKEFGDYKHTSVEQTAWMVNQYFQLKTKIHENPTIEDIAHIISKGNLIVAPCAGKLLENPYFINGGPRYHMIVIKGYDLEKNLIITHDVGTKRGADFTYSWTSLSEAIHDWHDQDMSLGKKLIIEVYP
ncbi:MAG: C39 family peptidase [Spirochaetes bacterium]|nr:C39 family peptidase [Spirochaetota bacterium]